MNKEEIREYLKDKSQEEFVHILYSNKEFNFIAFFPQISKPLFIILIYL